MKRSVACIGFLAVLTLSACGGSADDQETGSISAEEVKSERANLPAGVSAALDSGNAAYRANNYEAALAQYRQAVELQPDLAAAWFGIYMAELALGNTAGADSAMSVAQQLAPGASLIHPDRSPER